MSCSDKGGAQSATAWLCCSPASLAQLTLHSMATLTVFACPPMICQVHCSMKQLAQTCRSVDLRRRFCRVERGATPRKLAHEGAPASYASTLGTGGGLPSSQSLPPPRPVPVPGLAPPAAAVGAAALPRPSAAVLSAAAAAAATTAAAAAAAAAASGRAGTTKELANGSASAAQVQWLHRSCIRAMLCFWSPVFHSWKCRRCLKNEKARA